MPLISASTLFVHGVALTETNVGNNDLFDYMRRLWGTLLPESLSDSVAVNAAVESENNKVLASAADESFLGDVDDIDLFGEGGDSNNFNQAQSYSGEVQANSYNSAQSGYADSGMFTEADSNGLSGFNPQGVANAFDEDDDDMDMFNF